MTAWWGRLRVPSLVVDGAFAVAVTLFVVLTEISERRNHENVPTVGVLLLLGLAPGLAVRRRFPGTALVLATVVQVGLLATHTAPGANVPAELIAPYSVAAYAGRRVRIAVMVGAAVAAVAVAVPWWLTSVRDGALGFLVGGAGAWVLGAVLRGRREGVGRLAEHAGRLERERDLEARRAVADERLRIARELHDVVAHHLSVVVVQAQAMQPLLDRDPLLARELAVSLEETGREALEEMRHLLGVLRASDEPDVDSDAGGPSGPQPGLDRLEALVAQVQQAGLAVTVRTVGTVRRLSPGVELSAYRIVQEALTNALKHAGPAAVDVVVGYHEDALVLIVSDDGRGAAAALQEARLPGFGHGLVGMRERVAVFGGELTAGPRAGGGFEVRARIPVESELS